MVDKIKLQNFEDSRVWQAAVELATTVYGIVRILPKEENFALSAQLRRAVVSISTNVAEGFGRSGPKEKLQFYNIAYGSLLEVKSLLLVSEKLNYTTMSRLSPILTAAVSLQKQLNALKKSIRERSA